jgi:putative spermidine/putrescine transport system permease protein
VLPLVVILILAFSDAPFLEFPPPGFSFRWFANFVYRPGWLTATQTSIEVASLTMIFATLIGGLASVALVRISFRGKAFVTSLMLSPMVIPTVVFAIALYFLFAPMGLVGTRLGLLLGHVVLALPYVIIVISGALRSVDTSLERAAQVLGAPPAIAFLRVTLPAIRPAVLTAALFAFLASFDELVVALFISGTTAKTLPKRMWEGIREEIDPTIAAVAALLILVSLLFLILSEAVRLRRADRTLAARPETPVGLT